MHGLAGNRLKSVGYWQRGQSEDDAYDEAQAAAKAEKNAACPSN